jgi:hypothetical protein
MAFNDYNPNASINAPLPMDGQLPPNALMTPYLQALMRRQAKLGGAMQAPPQFNPTSPGSIGGPTPWWLRSLLDQGQQVAPSAPLGYDQQQAPGLGQQFERGAGGVGYGQGGVNAARPLDTSREQFQQSTTPAMSVMSGVPRAAQTFSSYQPLNNALSNISAPRVQGSAKKLASGGTKSSRPASSPTKGKLR